MLTMDQPRQDETAPHRRRAGTVLTAVVAMPVWAFACYLVVSVVVTRLLPSESLDPWPMGNRVVAMVLLYAPVAIAGLLLYRLRRQPVFVQLAGHAIAALVVLMLSLFGFGA